jgi:hypothetical protein
MTIRSRTAMGSYLPVLIPSLLSLISVDLVSEAVSQTLKTLSLSLADLLSPIAADLSFALTSLYGESEVVRNLMPGLLTIC